MRVSAPTVLVVGDAMLDRCVRVGGGARVTQEDPAVPVFPDSGPGDASASEAPGGAANLAANLAALGCDVTLRCPWAGDDAGDRLRELLAGFRVRLDAFGLADRTTVENRYYAGGRPVARVDADGRTSVPPPPPESGGSGYAAAVLTDYGKGCFPAGVGVRAADRGSGCSPTRSSGGPACGRRPGRRRRS